MKKLLEVLFVRCVWVCRPFFLRKPLFKVLKINNKLFYFIFLTNVEITLYFYDKHKNYKKMFCTFKNVHRTLYNFNQEFIIINFILTLLLCFNFKINFQPFSNIYFFPSKTPVSVCVSNGFDYCLYILNYFFRSIT